MSALFYQYHQLGLVFTHLDPYGHHIILPFIQCPVGPSESPSLCMPITVQVMIVGEVKCINLYRAIIFRPSIHSLNPGCKVYQQ